MPYTEEDKKKLVEMAFDFRHSELTTDESILRESEGYEAGALMNQEHEAHRKVEKMFRDRFLVDTKGADELRESFPELYEKAQAKRRKLEARANVSGFQKVKTDFLGNKKRKAQRKLDEIETDKQKLEYFRAGFEANSRLFENKTRELNRKIDRRRAELQAELATADEERKEKILYALNGLEGITKSDSIDGAYEMEDRLFRASEYCIDIHFGTDNFLKKEVVINPKTGKREILEVNKLYRDIARLACPLFKANEIQSRSDEAWKLADRLYVMQKGIHLALDEPKEDEIGHEVPKEATPQEQAENFQALMAHMEGIKQEYTNFMELHPELYITKPTDQTLLEDLEELYEAYKKAQVSDFVMGTLSRSKYFKMTKNDSPYALSDEDRKRFWDLRVFMSAFEASVHTLSSHVGPLGHYYLKHMNVDPENVNAELPTMDEYLELRKQTYRSQSGNLI